MAEPLRVFVSHASTYVELAKSLKLSLQALEPDVQLDIRISSEMAGATDWRDWIEENVRSANVFLLLYPHARMEMNWCNYELGRFYDIKGHIVCLKNVDIPKPPPAFEPYQAYSGDEEGLLKFLNELFVRGVFTSGKPLNPEVGKIGTIYYDRAREVASELAGRFSQARVREKLYDRYIEISLQYANQELDSDRTLVEGNPEGLTILGLDTEAKVSWSTLRSSLDPEHDWPAQLEGSLSAIAHGALPPSLSPFRTPKDVYIPVIAKAESVDNVLRRLSLIFITVPREDMQPLVDWVTPSAMPDTFSALIRLVRMMFRARWDILEPGLMDVRFRAPSKEQCAAVVESMLASYERMERDAERQGFVGPAKFLSVFDRSLRSSVESVGWEYLETRQTLKESMGKGNQEVADAIERLLNNNARWLQLAAKQFALSVEDLGEATGRAGPAQTP